MNKSKFYLFLLFLGLVIFSYNYWGDFVKTNVFDSFFAKEDVVENDYSWLSTYDESNKKVLRALPEEQLHDDNVNNTFSDQVKEVLSEKTEKERFVDATYKASCLVFSANGVFTQELEKKTMKAFENEGFSPEDKVQMDELIARYKDDVDYLKAVLMASEHCK
jgi:protease II